MKDWIVEENHRHQETIAKAYQRIGALEYYLTEFCETAKDSDNSLFKFRIENLAELAEDYLEEKS